MSKLVYMISVWSGCTKELLGNIQTIQNRAARVLTRNHWSVDNKTNLAQLGWLSVNQLSHYHNILLINQVKKNKAPKYLYEMFNWEFPYKTRQATSNQVQPKGTPKLHISLNTYRWRATVYYKKIPTSITQDEDERNFKVKLKTWILNNVPFKS